MQSTNHLYCHRLLLGENKKEALAVGESRQLHLWNVETEPRLEKTKQLDYWFDIRPMDAERFMVLNQSSFELEIWSWKNWKVLKRYLITPEDYDQLEDAVYLPKHQMVLVGGGWNPLYFLNLKDGSLVNAHANSMDFITYLQVNEEETLITHTNNDQFNEMGLYKIDWDNLKIELIDRIGGDLRCHRDVVRFNGDQLVHVWMDMYCMQRVYCWEYKDDQLTKLWDHSLPMIKYEHTASSNWKTGLCWGRRDIFIGAGQMLVRVNGGENRLAGRLGQFAVFDELIFDMVILNNSQEEILIATDQGLIKWHAKKDQLRGKRWKML